MNRTQHIKHYVIELWKYVLALTIWKLKWLNCVFIGSTIFTMKCVNWMECWYMKIYLISFRHTMKLWHSYTILMSLTVFAMNDLTDSFVEYKCFFFLSLVFLSLNLTCFVMCNGFWYRASIPNLNEVGTVVAYWMKFLFFFFS